MARANFNFAALFRINIYRIICKSALQKSASSGISLVLRNIAFSSGTSGAAGHMPNIKVRFCTISPKYIDQGGEKVVRDALMSIAKKRIQRYLGFFEGRCDDEYCLTLTKSQPRF